MSKKRTAEESNDDGQTTEASADLIQQDAKRPKLILWSDTTLQDLPIELLEDILIKTVVMEVKDLRLAKSVWKEKADLVMNRLGTVCSQWSNILTTNYFRKRLYGVLEDTAQKTFRLEILHQSTIQRFVQKVATMKDEVFMLCRPKNQEPFINVHDRNNMVEVKAVIPLPGTVPVDIVACGVSNCLYILNRNSNSPSVLRISKDEDHQYDISTWDNDLNLPFRCLFPGLNGKLIILSRKDNLDPWVVSIYNANGSLQHAITLFPAIHGFDFISSVIQMSNGNLVVATQNGTISNGTLHRDLTEIDAMGKIIRQYRSSVQSGFEVSAADGYGRICMSDPWGETELLDSECNVLDCTYPEQDLGLFGFPYKTHYSNDRNETASVRISIHSPAPDDFDFVLTISRCTDE